MFASKTSRVAIALMLFLLSAGVFWLIFRHKPSLLDHARRVPGSEGFTSQTVYYWLNEKELVYLTPAQKAGASTVIRLNTQTGQQTVQGELPNGGLVISPSGHWSLTYTAANTGFLYALQRTNGGAQGAYQSPVSVENYSPNLAWTPDDAQLIELQVASQQASPKSDKSVVRQKTHEGYLRIYSLEKPAPVASIATEESSPYLKLLGVLPDNRALIIDHDADAIHDLVPRVSRRIDMLDFPLQKNAAARHYDILMPEYTFDVEPALAPQGDRLAWLLHVYHKPLGHSILSRVYNLLHIYPHDTLDLWISTTDGSGLHSLGSMEWESGNDRYKEPSRLRWKPDGKGVSVAYRNALYEINVP